MNLNRLTKILYHSVNYQRSKIDYFSKYLKANRVQINFKLHYCISQGLFVSMGCWKDTSCCFAISRAQGRGVSIDASMLKNFFHLRLTPVKKGKIRPPPPITPLNVLSTNSIIIIESFFYVFKKSKMSIQQTTQVYFVDLLLQIEIE